jgi:hypothetical protein
VLKPEQHHLKELIDDLRADIRALTHALNEHAQIVKHTECSRNTSQQQAEESRIRAIVLEQIQSERNHAETNSKQHNWSSFEKWYFTIIKGGAKIDHEAPFSGHFVAVEK